jgi:hypothetical protein
MRMQRLFFSFPRIWVASIRGTLILLFDGPLLERLKVLLSSFFPFLLFSTFFIWHLPFGRQRDER